MLNMFALKYIQKIISIVVFVFKRRYEMHHKKRQLRGAKPGIFIKYIRIFNVIHIVKVIDNIVPHYSNDGQMVFGKAAPFKSSSLFFFSFSSFYFIFFFFFLFSSSFVIKLSLPFLYYHPSITLNIHTSYLMLWFNESSSPTKTTNISLKKF